MNGFRCSARTLAIAATLALVAIALVAIPGAASAGRGDKDDRPAGGKKDAEPKAKDPKAKDPKGGSPAGESTEGPKGEGKKDEGKKDEGKKDEPKKKEHADHRRTADERGSRRHDDTLPRPARPQVGKSVSAVPFAGQAEGAVKVKLPGGKGFIPLERAASVPVGSVVDTRVAPMALTTARPGGGTQWAWLYGSKFRVQQNRRDRTGMVDLRLLGGGIQDCDAPAPRIATLARAGAPFASAARRKRRAFRGLWATGKGRFRTRGRHGAATVRGTTWLTLESCDATAVAVTEGAVAVRDYVKRRTRLVRTGQTHVAWAKGKGPRRAKR